MAVTAEDRKYLNQAGIQKIQEATDAWNKAYAIGDTAGMAKAAADAAAVRSNSLYQASGGPGYTTDSWGRYVAPITPTSTDGGGSSGGASDPYANRDIAAEIIALLTRGGPIDYAQLNTLARQRDAKIASNPELYGQFESTQDIINRYLPIAQQNQRVEIDNLISLLAQLGQQPIQRMSFEEAQQRASSELNPMYEDASRRLMQALNADMEQRGIYNSPLASGIMTEKQGQLLNDQIAAIAQRANELIQNDAEMSLQERQLRSNTLNNLLSSLIGREVNLANITGTYNGQPTFANQQFQAQQALREAELTGYLNGTQTLAGRAFDLQASTQALNNALNAVESLGRVTTQEQADLLGVPIGTPSWQAREAAERRAQELQMFNQEMALRRQSEALRAEADRQNQLLANFNKDMVIWETTGKAPDTEAMRYYGIAPGTPFSQEAKQSVSEKLQETQDRIQLIAAEEELQFQNRVTNFMKTYGVTRGVAEAALIIIDQTSTFKDARNMVNAQKSALTAEGINTTNLINVLEKYFNTQDTYGGVNDKTGAAPSTGNIPNNWSVVDNSQGVADYLNKLYKDIEDDVPVTNAFLGGIFIKRNGTWYQVN